MKFKFLEHTADIKFQAFGKNLNEAFENSALATFNAMYPEKIAAKIKKSIKVKGKDIESLLYNFLEELIVLLDSKNFFLSNCNVKINKEKLELKAELVGDNAKNYSIGLDVKAITYNEMFVKKGKEMWVCQVVIDV
jgi:SHS2 domain-containing protein